jgi:RNA polymerase sigma-70 factor (ECF subfamily)
MTQQPPHPGTTDEALMPRIAAGDPAAFSELFRRRQGDVYRFALHMTGCPQTAEDVTQDVFLSVMRDAGRFELQRGSVAGWLCGIARNHVRRRFEQARDHRPLDEGTGDGDLQLPAVIEDPLGDLTRAERVAALKRSILSLPLRYREAVVLCDLQEMSYSDAAMALGCAVGTVRSRLHRGRALLAVKIAALETLERVPAEPEKPRGRRCFA